MKLEVNSPHPSVEALYELMTTDEWEDLAALSSVGVATRMPNEKAMERLRDRGLVALGGRLTAAGYALLFAWLRRHSRKHNLVQRWRLSPELRKHHYRMKVLLLSGIEEQDCRNL